MYIKIGGTGEQLPADAATWAAVLDTATGLMWEAHPTNKRYRWDDIGQRAAEANADGLCGHSDWRAPTIEELRSLVKEGVGSPTIDTEHFPNTPASYFWSSSIHASFLNNAWFIDFHNGYAYDNNKKYAEFVRLVRSQRLG